MMNLVFIVANGGGVPVGSYVARFEGIESVPADNDKGYKAGIRWKFTVMKGQFEGASCSRITPPQPTLKNVCGRMLAGLAGQSLTSGGEIDLTSHVGKTYLIVVGESQGGATRVETVSVLPQM